MRCPRRIMKSVIVLVPDIPQLSLLTGSCSTTTNRISLGTWETIHRPKVTKSYHPAGGSECGTGHPVSDNRGASILYYLVEENNTMGFD